MYIKFKGRQRRRKLVVSKAANPVQSSVPDVHRAPRRNCPMLPERATRDLHTLQIPQISRQPHPHRPTNKDKAGRPSIFSRQSKTVELFAPRTKMC